MKIHNLFRICSTMLPEILGSVIGERRSGFASGRRRRTLQGNSRNECKNPLDLGTAQPTASDFVIERKINEKASLNRNGDKRIDDRSAAAFGCTAHHPGSQN
jgi:hypothetical protein